MSSTARPYARAPSWRVLSPVGPARSLWRHRELIRQLVIRDLQQRYRGSYLGILWSVITPLLMLSAYTLVFAVILQARWAVGDQQLTSQEFALVVFAGLIPFSLLAECLNRAPGLVLLTPNYVKKVVFPLEVLPVVLVCSAALQSLISTGVLVLGTALLLGHLSPTLPLLPLAYLPLLLLALGVSWFLAGLGVYVRDVSQSIGVLTQLLMFLSPVFYPISAVPEWLRPWLRLNPLTAILEAFRATLLFGEPLPWESWAAWTLATALLAVLGYNWFVVTKRTFADVI
ncbi:MAG TPA: ABC transporter permease [Chloroflexota bacterium]